MIDTNKYFYSKNMHVELAEELNRIAARKGVQVSRWVNNSKNRQIVTYMVHEGERNQFASKQENVLFSINEDAGRGGQIYDEQAMIREVRAFLNSLPELYEVVSEYVGDSEPATLEEITEIVSDWEYEGWTLEVHTHGDDVLMYAYDETGDAERPNSFSHGWTEVTPNIYYHKLARCISTDTRIVADPDID
jgi:hypothetical protein